MIRLSALVLVMFFQGCATPERPIIPQGSVSDQILVIRKGHKGLTHGSCQGFDKTGACSNFAILEYDLENPEARQTLRDLNFLCKIGNKRFTICQNQPGFCHHSYETSYFLWFKRQGKAIDEYIDQKEQDRLLNLGATCFNPEAYPQLEVQ